MIYNGKFVRQRESHEGMKIRTFFSDEFPADSCFVCKRNTGKLIAVCTLVILCKQFAN